LSLTGVLNFWGIVSEKWKWCGRISYGLRAVL